MAATASIIIEVNDQGATQAFQRINAESVALGNNLRPIGPLSDEAFGQMESSTRRARESCALVSEELGVHIPRAMRGVIAGMPGISQAMNVAFSGLAIVGFIGIAEQAGQAVVKLVEYFTGWAEEAKATMDAETALNQQIKQTKDHLAGLQEAYKLIGLQGLPLYSEKQKEANEALKAAKKNVDDLTASQKILFAQSQEMETTTIIHPGVPALSVPPTSESTTGPTDAAVKAKAAWNDVGKQLDLAHAQVADLEQALTNAGKTLGDAFSKEKAEGIHEIGVAAQEALTKLQAMTKTAASGGNTPEQAIDANKRALEEQIADLLTFSGDEETVRRAAAAAVNAIEKKASDDRVKLLTDEADKKLKAISDGYEAEDKLAQEQAVKMRKIETDTEKEETDAAIALAPPWERANAKIVEDYQEKMQKIAEMRATNEIDDDQAARRYAAAWTTAFAQARDEMANKMETLFDDITSGHIGQAFLDMFKKLVFQMLATWIMGMKGMQAATSQTMTGQGGSPLQEILSALGMGGMSGGGGAGGGVPTASLDDLDALGVTSSAGVAMSAGAGSGGYGTVLPAGAARGGASGSGGLSALLKGGMLNQLLITGGAGLLINGTQRGGILGVLEDVTGGAMAGFGIGAAIGSAFGPIGMGIGALIGGLVGIFSSIFGEHTGDKARKQVMEPLDAQIKVIEDSYDVFATDYNTGVSELEQLRSDSIAALKKIGGSQVKGNTKWVNIDIDAAEAHLKTTEAERQRRSQLDFGPAQFREGGFVHPSLAGGAPDWFAGTAMHFATGGAVPAILHGGEFVVNSSATQRLGPGNLARANAGGSLGGDTHVYNISTMDSKSFTGWLRDGGLRVIMQEIRRSYSEGGF